MSIDEAREYTLGAGDVAAVFAVDPKTVSRWADVGYLPCLRTPGGHRRYRPADVEALLQR